MKNLKNFQTITPPNASEYEVALDQIEARLDNLPVLIKHIKRAMSVPDAFLPWLAWEESVDIWNPDWPTATKRRVIADSFRLHQIKGTRKAVEMTIESVFGAAELEEWFEFNGDPDTFRIRTGGLFDNPGAYDELIKLIDAAKPLTSWLISIILERKASQHLIIGLAYHQAAASTVGVKKPEIKLKNLKLEPGFHTQKANKKTVFSNYKPPKLDKSFCYFGVCIQTARFLTVFNKFKASDS